MSSSWNLEPLGELLKVPGRGKRMRMRGGGIAPRYLIRNHILFRDIRIFVYSLKIHDRVY